MKKKDELIKKLYEDACTLHEVHAGKIDRERYQHLRKKKNPR
jgi:hypothetical protein